ncbi:DNA adenine methylase [Pseudomonas cedrina]|uniref:DNA adenine methylase n=1 Tax=Pseudomonas cedrina TaxID=651740 RepID=UPI003ED99B9F
MKYPGGKGKCYQRLINLMPAHQTYIESHLGSGAVLRHKKPALRNIGIDLDPTIPKRWAAEPVRPEFEWVNADAATFLSDFPYSGHELVYADPPYLASTRRREKVYRYDYCEGDHRRLLEVLKRLPCSVMISGYESPLYDELLQGWRKTTFAAKTHAEVRQECVWMNFAPPQHLHDTRYLGHTFRERQTISRRQERLRTRIDAMDPVERNDLVRWMTETYGQEQGGMRCKQGSS